MLGRCISFCATPPDDGSVTPVCALVVHVSAFIKKKPKKTNQDLFYMKILKVGQSGKVDSPLAWWPEQSSPHVEDKPPGQQPETYYSRRFIMTLALQWKMVWKHELPRDIVLCWNKTRKFSERASPCATQHIVMPCVLIQAWTKEKIPVMVNLPQLLREG